MNSAKAKTILLVGTRREKETLLAVEQRIIINSYALNSATFYTPLGTMSQSAERVIPDERRFAGRDPCFDRPFDRITVLSKVEGESSECSMTSFGVWFPAFAGTLSGSRLASAADGLGRDDEL
jgi:hypothetical protein